MNTIASLARFVFSVEQIYQHGKRCKDIFLPILGAGFLVDRFHSKIDLILAICMVSCSALNAVIPHSPWIELLYIVFLLEGVFEVIVNLGKL